MATCTYNPGVSSSNPYAVLEVKQVSQSVADNNSKVSWALKMYRPYSISSSASKSYSVTVNGRTESGSVTIGGSGTKTLASGTITVPHNSDGTKTISFSFSLDFEITWGSTWIGTGSASGSLKLTTIPRATTPTLNPKSVTIGNTMTISLPRASSSFVHALTYRFGSVTGAIGYNLGTSATWTLPMSLISEIPNAVSGTGTIVCNTYNNGTLIGSKSVTFTASVPSSVVPSISSVSITEATAGIASKFAAYVQSKSKLSVSITAAGSYGSSIKKYETIVSGTTYTGSKITTGVLTSSGNITVTLRVTDSRGRTATTTRTISVTAYSAPKINSFSVVRATSDGTADEDDGTYMLASVNFSISAVGNKNDKTYKIEYKKATDASWTAVLSGSVYSMNGTLKSTTPILDIDYEYQIRLTISDYFGAITPYVVNVSAGGTLIDYYRDGNGISFGRAAQRAGYVDSYLPLHGFAGITYDIPAVSAADFNSFETSGVFYLYGVTSAKNAPVASNGWLEVMKYSTGSYIFQRYTTIGGAKYERIKAAGTWRGWTHVPVIQHGSVLKDITANVQTSFSVTFPIQFADVPTVVITPMHNSDVTALQFKLKTVTATGFTGYIYSSGGGTHRFYWMAML